MADEKNVPDWMMALSALLAYETPLETRKQILKKMGIVITEDISNNLSEMCRIGKEITARSSKKAKTNGKAKKKAKGKAETA